MRRDEAAQSGPAAVDERAPCVSTSCGVERRDVNHFEARGRVAQQPMRTRRESRRSTNRAGLSPGARSSSRWHVAKTRETFERAKVEELVKEKRDRPRRSRRGRTTRASASKAVRGDRKALAPATSPRSLAGRRRPPGSVRASSRRADIDVLTALAADARQAQQQRRARRCRIPQHDGNAPSFERGDDATFKRGRVRRSSVKPRARPKTWLARSRWREAHAKESGVGVNAKRDEIRECGCRMI